MIRRHPLEGVPIRLSGGPIAMTDTNSPMISTPEKENAIVAIINGQGMGLELTPQVGGGTGIGQGQAGCADAGVFGRLRKVSDEDFPIARVGLFRIVE